MLPKKHRLTQDKDFKRIFKKGKFFIVKFINIRIVENNLDVSRFGFIISKKNFKKAVDRNKIKRRLRDTIHSRLEKIKPGFDVVVMIRKEIGNKSFKEIDEVMEEILNKAKILI